MNFAIGEPLNSSVQSAHSSTSFISCIEEEHLSDSSILGDQKSPKMSIVDEVELMDERSSRSTESEDDDPDDDVDDMDTRDMLKEVLKLARKTSRKLSRHRDDQIKLGQNVDAINDRLLSVENKVSSNEVGLTTVNARVDGVQEDLGKLKEDFFERLRSVELNLKNDIANRPSGSGGFKLFGKGPRDLKNKAEGEFYSLVNQATAKRHVFVVGHVTNDHGTPIPTTITVKDILLKYFSTVDYELLTTNPSSVTNVRRFRVHPSHIPVTKQMARDLNPELRSHGWWIQQETPNELRKMNSMATKFFMEVKKLQPALRRYNFDVDCGFITIDGAVVLPVFMVTEDGRKWNELSELLVEIVRASLNLPWLLRMATPIKIEYEMLQKWGKVVGHKPSRSLYESVTGPPSASSPVKPQGASSIKIPITNQATQLDPQTSPITVQTSGNSQQSLSHMGIVTVNAIIPHDG